MSLELPSTGGPSWEGSSSSSWVRRLPAPRVCRAGSRLLLQDGVVQAGCTCSPESMVVQVGLTLKLSSIAAVCGENKRHEQEWEDKDRRQGAKQREEGRAAKPYLHCLVESSSTATACACGRATAVANRQLPAGTGFAGSLWKRCYFWKRV